VKRFASVIEAATFLINLAMKEDEPTQERKRVLGDIGVST